MPRISACSGRPDPRLILHPAAPSRPFLIVFLGDRDVARSDVAVADEHRLRGARRYARLISRKMAMRMIAPTTGSRQENLWVVLPLFRWGLGGSAQKSHTPRGRLLWLDMPARIAARL